MKNICEVAGECIKVEVLYKKIFEKIKEIGCKTYKVKRMEDEVYGEMLKRPNETSEEKKENDRFNEVAYDGFSERWKDISEGKDEVEWMMRTLYLDVEYEEERRIRKIEKKKI